MTACPAFSVLRYWPIVVISLALWIVIFTVSWGIVSLL